MDRGVIVVGEGVIELKDIFQVNRSSLKKFMVILVTLTENHKIFSY